MARVTQPQVAAWAEASKMGTSAGIVSLDTNLLDQLEAEVISRLSGAGFDTTTWVDASTTPSIIRVAIAKMYVSWIIDRQYSEDEDLNAYAARLDANAAGVIEGLVSGEIIIPGSPEVAGQPAFYPTDESSAQRPTFDDPSLGPAHFSMGQVF